MSVTAWWLLAVLILAVPTYAADDVQERAVPNTGLRQNLVPEGSVQALEKRVAQLQQQVDVLTAQLGALQSVLKVTPTGATLQAPTVTMIASEGLALQSGKGVTVTAGTSLDVRAAMATSIRSGMSTLLEGAGSLDLKGGVLRLNGGTKPIATIGSQVQLRGGQVIGTVQGGSVIGTPAGGEIVTGSTTILGN